ncbi:hypothetical protein [Agromyces seonyuensis]|uniref:Uncharacterized protein n=1 Tax=Agromyces seonyuensis TaxID=2662446 RepID=A0A6I4NYK3_9MICO|nr:hypothetical protein [Agromyces seonyuensis]MWB99450.1 hypothetical protein [Agromyces seonyuensis]
MSDTQDEPIMDGWDDATRGEQLEGIIQQVRADLAGGAVDDLPTMVRQRLEDAGLPSGPSDVDAVVSAVGAGGVG